MTDKWKLANALMKKIMPYYDKATKSLKKDAPPEAVENYKRLEAIMEDMTITTKSGPQYPTEEEAKKNSRHNK